MKTAKNRHEEFLQRFKKETILRWMASLTVTVVTVATVVVVTSREEPTVRFKDVSAVGNQIVYHAEVLDPGQTFVNDSLVLDIQTSLELTKFRLLLAKLMARKKCGISQVNIPLVSKVHKASAKRLSQLKK